MSKKHDENKDLRLISRIAKIDYVNKTIQCSKNTLIGNTTWGRIDYLTHYCGWAFVWNNEVSISKTNVSTDNDVKKRKRETKRLVKEASLNNKNKKKNNGKAV